MMTGSDIDRHMNLSNMRPKLKQHILDLYQERQALMSDVESSQKIIKELNEQQQIAASAHQSALKAARAKLNAAGTDARHAENLQEAERAHLEDELLVKEEDAAKLRRKLATMTMSATKQRKRAQRLTDGANEADVETEQVERDAVIKCVGQQVLDLVVDPHRPRLTPPRAASPSDTWCSVARPTAPCPPCPSPSSSTRWTAVDRAPMPSCLWHPWRWSSCLPSSPQSRPA